MAVELPYELWVKICKENIRKFGSWKNRDILLIQKSWTRDLLTSFYQNIVLFSPKALRSLNRTLLLFSDRHKFIKSLWVCFGFSPPRIPAFYDNSFPFEFHLDRSQRSRSYGTYLAEPDIIRFGTLLGHVRPFLKSLSILCGWPYPDLREVITEQRFGTLEELQVPAELFCPRTDLECTRLDDIFGHLRRLRIAYDADLEEVGVAMRGPDFSWLSSLTHLYLAFGITPDRSQVTESVLSIVVADEVEAVVVECECGESIPFDIKALEVYSAHPKAVFVVREDPSAFQWDLEFIFQPGDRGYQEVQDLTLYVSPEAWQYQCLWEAAKSKVNTRWATFEKAFDRDTIDLFRGLLFVRRDVLLDKAH